MEVEVLLDMEENLLNEYCLNRDGATGCWLVSVTSIVEGSRLNASLHAKRTIVLHEWTQTHGRKSREI